MRALWQAAVAVQLDDVVRLQAEAQQAIAESDVARTDAETHFDPAETDMNYCGATLVAHERKVAAQLKKKVLEAMDQCLLQLTF